MHFHAPVIASSVVEEIVHRIEKAVDRGELLSGQQLIEEKLVAVWQVSRPSLREAFRILEASGYVERKPRKGVFISPITPKHVFDLYEIRAVLEGLAARLTVERGDQEVFASLQDLDARMRRLALAGDTAGYSELNQDFHRILIEASGNELLQKLLIPINKQAKRYRRLAHIDTSLHTDSNLSHEEILTAMKDHDASGVEEARRARIRSFAHHIAAKIAAQQARRND